MLRRPFRPSPVRTAHADTAPGRPTTRRSRRFGIHTLVALLVIGTLAPVTASAAEAQTSGGATPRSQTPVMTSTPRLTEAELLAWYQGSWRPTYRATVPPAELIAAFAEAGRSEGVAWDVAFVQSALETAWFSYPSTGMVRPEANNFGGLGAFDSSAGQFVFQFPDARTGARAQMQHLRLYADPTTALDGSNLGAPLAQDRENRYPARWRTVRSIRNNVTGQFTFAASVRNWEDLGNGLWATDPFYSCKILNLYRQALQFNGKSAAGLPTNPTCLRTWYQRNSNTRGEHDTMAFLGREGESVLACDFNGNGRDTPATFFEGQWRISNNANGSQPIALEFGRRGDLPLCGDWDGDGRAGIGVVRDGEWHLKNTLDAAPGDVPVFTYGRVTRGDVPVVGNWNGLPGDGIGIIRGGEWHLRNTLGGGNAEHQFVYGQILRGDLPLVGDWNGNGVDGVGIVRGGEWHLRSTLSAGPGERRFVYGRVGAGDVPVVGDWNGSGIATPAIVR